MRSKEELISRLQGTETPLRQIKDRQTVNDIMKAVLDKHVKCRADYDMIFQDFLGGSIYDISKRLWKFCKDNFEYDIESEEKQFVSSPYSMLTGGMVDCKNYALFIGGVLDAMKRAGKRLEWQYRFASYELFDTDPGHVFVVVNPNTDDIWIDPVLSSFNNHLFYWYKRDKKPKPAGTINGIGKIGVTKQEQDLLDQLHEYTEGLVNAVQVSTTTNSINTLTAGILQGASSSIPEIAAAQAFLKQGTILLNNAFGPGSTAARVFSDLSSGKILQAISDLFTGRTYDSDQYWGATYYKFNVLGQNITNQNQIIDADIIPALKWFIDRTGVFISGRQHIIALTQSPQAYLNYYKVNGYTTTDPARVQAAYQVASRYWVAPGNYSPQYMGSWKNTIGVFDNGLAQIANSLGLTAEQYAAQTGYQYATDQTTAATQLIPGLSNTALYVAAGGLILMGLLKDK